MKNFNDVILTGVLSPFSWDKKEIVNNYSIFTQNDEDIILQGKTLRNKFKKYRNKNVQVSGHFLTPANGVRVFEVSNTTLL